MRIGRKTRTRPAHRLALVACLLLALAGCDAASRSDGDTGAENRPEIRSPSGEPPTTAASKVLVVIEENHTLEQMREGMPFLAQVSDKYGYATRWTAITHPSEPNYLAIAGGSTFGISDDKAPQAHAQDVGSATSVFDQAVAVGKTAATYAESMPQPCHVYDDPDQAVGVPLYAVRHNAWVYFTAGRQACLAGDVGLEEFARDVGDDALPNVGFLIPNLEHDAHDGTLAEADTWLEQQLSPVLQSHDFTSGHLVVVVTADEDDRSADNTVLTSVLTPALSGEVVDTPLTHYSLTRYICQVLGVEPLGQGAEAPDLAAAFGL
ncbi:MAG: hypothetical protein JWN84_4555 [Nocardioides sp.]|jgi:hypothetical protein|nr:hypothetical protein [Nocardioides sp.]